MSGRVGSITTDIIANGLVFNMDAANRASYSRRGNIVNNTIGSQTGSFSGTGGSNNLPQWRNNQRGAFNSDGTDDVIKFEDVSFLNTDTGTVSIWVKTVDAIGSGAQQTFLCFRGAGSRNYVEFANLDDGKLKVGIRIWGDRWRIHSDDVIFSDDTWVNITLVANGEGLDPTLYVNGVNAPYTYDVLNASYRGYWWSHIQCHNSHTWLGARNFNGGYQVGHNGDIANLQIYTVTLSASEVLHNYNALRGRFNL